MKDPKEMSNAELRTDLLHWAQCVTGPLAGSLIETARRLEQMDNADRLRIKALEEEVDALKSGLNKIADVLAKYI